VLPSLYDIGAPKEVRNYIMVFSQLEDQGNDNQLETWTGEGPGTKFYFRLSKQRFIEMLNATARQNFEMQRAVLATLGQDPTNIIGSTAMGPFGVTTSPRRPDAAPQIPDNYLLQLVRDVDAVQAGTMTVTGFLDRHPELDETDWSEFLEPPE
jgi:hypothetical protein